MPGRLNFAVADAAVRALDKELKRQEKKVRKGAAIALTKTAKRAESAIREEMPRVFDRPTRWTLNGLFTIPANYRSGRFEAAVKAKDSRGLGTKGTEKYAVPAAEYLKTQVEGGQRPRKRYEEALEYLGILQANEFTVPGSGARLNKFGNIPRGQYARMLSDVQAKSYKTPAAARYDLTAGQATLKSGKKKYFYDPRKTPPTIWVRTGKTKIKPFLIIVKGAPTYRKRLDFYGIAQKTFLRHIDDELDAAIDFLSKPYQGPR